MKDREEKGLWGGAGGGGGGGRGPWGVSVIEGNLGTVWRFRLDSARTRRPDLDREPGRLARSLFMLGARAVSHWRENDALLGCTAK